MKITRSFSQKLNLGNYQTADFFCSAEVECDESEFVPKSEELHSLCKREVEVAMDDYKLELEDKKPKIKQDVIVGKKIQLP